MKTARWFLTFAALIVMVLLPLEWERSAVAQVPRNVAVITSFQFVVTTAATPAQLGTSTGATVTGTQPTFCRQVTIQPLNANTTARVTIMPATGAANTGYELQAGQQLTIPMQGPLTSLWIRVGTNGDGVSVICWSD